MAKNKTVATAGSVDAFLSQLKDDIKRKDSVQLIALLKKQTGFEPKIWGTAIIGFGSYHYTYESGHKGDMALVSFSPRASAITLYVSGNFEGREALLNQLGKHTAGKGCIYIKKLADVHTGVLEKIIAAHIAYVREKNP